MRITRKNRVASTLVAVIVGGASLAAAPATVSAREAGGKATVVHGVPGLTVDVYANGDTLLEDFVPGDIAGPVDLATGDYKIELTAADSSDVVLSANATITDGANVTAAAHLTAAGDPAIGLFKNKMNPIRPRKARVSLRHIASAPPVDVRFRRPAGSWKLFAEDIGNGEQATRAVRKGKYRFDVVLAGTKSRVLGPTKLVLARRMHYFVYAWGSASEGNLALNLSTQRLARR